MYFDHNYSTINVILSVCMHHATCSDELSWIHMHSTGRVIDDCGDDERRICDMKLKTKSQKYVLSIVQSKHK